MDDPDEAGAPRPMRTAIIALCLFGTAIVVAIVAIAFAMAPQKPQGAKAGQWNAKANQGRPPIERRSEIKGPSEPEPATTPDGLRDDQIGVLAILGGLCGFYCVWLVVGLSLVFFAAMFIAKKITAAKNRYQQHLDAQEAYWRSNTKPPGEP